LKSYLPILIIFIFSFLQAANLVISFLNHEDALTEILIENQENERDTKEDFESCKYFSFLAPNWAPLSFLCARKRNTFHDVMTSQLYLTKPETPPPNFA
jgi:hypothetical protein